MKLLSAIVATWLCLLAAAVQAQAPEIAGLLPCGGQRGATAAVGFDGKNLQGVTPLFSGHGIHLDTVDIDKMGQHATLKLRIDPDAPIGVHEIRLGSAKGVSNPVRFWVDAFPDALETEPNDDFDHAQPLPRTPLAINGRIQAQTDRDTFSFQADSGETWVFDCCAARVRSRLDPILELHDSEGNLLRMAQSAWERDPRLTYRITQPGHYFITVRDTQFQGGPDYFYRLTAGRLPTITGFLPRGAQPGKSLDLSFAGINLGMTTRAAFVIPSDAPLGDYWISPMTDLGPALPIALRVEPEPAFAVSESPAPIPLPTLPVSLDGLFLQTSRQSFLFHATPQERLEFDLLGQRIGSRIDGALSIRDRAGKEIASNDDAVGKDARLEFVAPAEGDYTVEARDVEERPGLDSFYRLKITRIIPDFQMLLGEDRLEVGAGGTIAVSVSTERLNHFAGPITVMADGLPAGVTSRGGVIEPGQNSVEITLTAKPGTALGPTAIHLRGSALVDGKLLTREAAPRTQYMPRSIDPGMFQDDSYKRPYYVYDSLPLGVIARAEPFALETDVPALTLAPGQKAEIVVKALRTPGADGEIKLELRGLPEKVTAAVPAIAAKQIEAHITLTAALDAPLTIRNLIVQGHLGPAAQVAPAVTLTLHR